jgi:hypothetical protein
MFKNSLPVVVLLAGMAISMTMVLLLPDLYHSNDWNDMFLWAGEFGANWKDIYINCDRCTYPFIGILVSAGLIHMLDSTSFTDTALLFRLVLGIVDAANVFLLYLLMEQLGIRKSALWAGIVGLLPSSWVGGALWGQIDSFSQFFLLLALLSIAHFNRAMLRGEKRRTVPAYLLLIGLPVTFLLLTKQLAVFNVLVLEGMVLANLLLVYRSIPRAVASFGLFLAWQVAIVLAFDLFLEVQNPYLSHLAYVWLVRSRHMNKISGNGLNIWIFLGWAQGASSKEAFYLTLTPRDTGIGLFLGWMALLSTSLLMQIRKLYRTHGPRAIDRETFSDLIFFLALTNLCFNVFLSGTHERYLYHFYPMIIVGFLGLRAHSTLFSRTMLATLLFGAVSYGLYVFEILSGELPMALFIFKDAKFQAAFHLFLLLYLSLAYLRYHDFVPRIRELVTGLSASKLSLDANDRAGAVEASAYKVEALSRQARVTEA